MWNKEVYDRREFGVSWSERVDEEVLSFEGSLQYEQIWEVGGRGFSDGLWSHREDGGRIVLIDHDAW